MAKSNKHHTNSLLSVALDYVKEMLGEWKKCLRKNCTGTMLSVLVRYEDKGKIYEEMECSTCGKVVKDPQWRIDREKAQQEQRNRGGYRGNNNRRHWNSNYRNNNR